MTICNTCGQGIRPGKQLTIIHWNEGDERVHRDCTAAAIGRANAAEAEVERLKGQVDEAETERDEWYEAAETTETDLGRFMDDLIAVVGEQVIVGDEVKFSAVVAAVAALRSRLDAARWRLSATEKPAAPGVEVDVRATGLYDEAGWSIYKVDQDVSSAIDAIKQPTPLLDCVMHVCAPTPKSPAS